MLNRRILEMILVAFFVAYLTAMGFVFSSSEQPCPETNKQSSTDRAYETSKGQQDESIRHWMMHDAAGFFTLCLVIVGGGQLVLFSVQLKYIRKSLDDAKTAANAAKKSADSLRNIERAYVFIDYELLMKRNAALKVGGIHNKQIALVFKNFGRTPAIVNGINCKCHHWPNRYLPEMETDSIKIPIGIAIGSSSPWSIPAIFEGTECDINDAMSGAGSIYLYGKITYLDMLGEQRETGFCCEWSFAEGQFLMAPNTKLNYHT